MIFERDKTEVRNLRLSKLPSTNVLLKLEFDTEDQVLYLVISIWLNTNIEYIQCLILKYLNIWIYLCWPVSHNRSVSHTRHVSHTWSVSHTMFVYHKRSVSNTRFVSHTRPVSHSSHVSHTKHPSQTRPIYCFSLSNICW